MKETVILTMMFLFIYFFTFLHTSLIPTAPAFRNLSCFLDIFVHFLGLDDNVSKSFRTFGLKTHAGLNKSLKTIFRWEFS